MSRDACPFCEPDPELVFYRGSRVLGLWDAFPVSEGHALLVPQRHIPTWFDASREEQVELTQSLTLAREAILARHTSTPNRGFNIGINIGEAGGQTVSHLHVHLIPRYRDDVEDPRGGVRHVIPSRANYLLPTDAGPDRVSDRPLEASFSALVTGEDDPLLPHLLRHLDESGSADLLASFILASGVQLLEGHLADLLERGGRIRILTGDYLGITGLPAVASGEGGTPTPFFDFSTSRKEPRASSTSASSFRRNELSSEGLPLLRTKPHRLRRKLELEPIGPRRRHRVELPDPLPLRIRRRRPRF